MRGGARRYSWLGFSEADRCEGPLWVESASSPAILAHEAVVGQLRDLIDLIVDTSARNSNARTAALRWLGVAVVITGCVARADTASDIPAPVRASLSCIIRLLKSNSQFQSIAVYSVDHFRNALEYTIHGKDDHALTSDILVSGPFDGVLTWSLVSQHGETPEQGFEELEVLMKSLPS
jgi:hypothetical protein